MPEGQDPNNIFDQFIFRDPAESKDSDIAGEVRSLKEVLVSILTSKKFREVELGPGARRALRQDGEEKFQKWSSQANDPKYRNLTNREAARRGILFSNAGSGPKSKRPVSSSSVRGMYRDAKKAVSNNEEVKGYKDLAGDLKKSVIREDGSINLNPLASAAVLKRAVSGKDEDGKGYGRRVKYPIRHLALAAATSPAALNRYQRMAEGAYMGVAGQDIEAMSRFGFSGGQGKGAAFKGVLNQVLGLETIGYLGGANLAFGNEAQRAAVGDRIDTFRAAFNPFDALSMADDQNIKGLVRGAGFRMGSDREKKIIREMRDLKQSGFQPEEIFPYIELFVKKLNMSADEIANSIETFQERAMSAGKSLDEYIKIVTASAQASIQQGVDPKTAEMNAMAAAQFKNITPESFAKLGRGMDPGMIEVLQETAPEILQDPLKLLEYQQNPERVLGDKAPQAKILHIQKTVDFYRNLFPTASDEALYDKAAQQLGITHLEVKEGYEEGDERLEGLAERSDIEVDLSKSQSAIERMTKENKGAAFGFIPPEIKDKIDEAKEEQKRLLERYRSTIESQGVLSEGGMEEIDKMVAEGKDPGEIIEKVQKLITEEKESEFSGVINVKMGPELHRILDIDESIDIYKTNTERNRRNQTAPGVNPFSNRRP